MDGADTQPASHVSIYFRVWLGIVVCALTLRSTIFYGPWGEHCGLSFAYILVTWPPIMILHFLNYHRLKLHLQRHHPEKWKELDGYECDGSTTYRSLRHRQSWFFSTEDLGDPVVSQMKKDQVLFIALVLGVFFTYVVMFPLLTYEHAIWPFSRLLH